MQELKVKLFNFRKNLELDENELYELVSAHLNIVDTNSHITIVQSINEMLKTYVYIDKVQAFLEELNQMIEQDPVYYNLEDICVSLDKKDREMHQGITSEIRKIMDIKDTSERKSTILSVLPDYEWVGEVQSFLNYFSQKPLIVTKDSNDPGARVEDVFGFVESVEGGAIIFTNNNWFLVKNESITIGDPLNHFDNNDKLNQLFRLQEAAKRAELAEGRLTFRILENLDLTLDEKSGLLLNGEQADIEETLESVYKSGIISAMDRGLLDIIKEASKNVKKFMQIDIAKKVYNIGDPTSEAIVFNHNEKLYVFFNNEQFGADLYEHESAEELNAEMKGKFGADIYDFIEDKFPEAIREKKNLEREIAQLNEQVNEIDENIEKLETTGMIGEDPTIATAHQALVDKRAEILDKIKSVKNSIAEA